MFIVRLFTLTRDTNYQYRNCPEPPFVIIFHLRLHVRESHPEDGRSRIFRNVFTYL